MFVVILRRDQFQADQVVDEFSLDGLNFPASRFVLFVLVLTKSHLARLFLASVHVRKLKEADVLELAPVEVCLFWPFQLEELHL